MVFGALLYKTNLQDQNIHRYTMYVNNHYG